jgi:hypothetical protein
MTGKKFLLSPPTVRVIVMGEPSHSKSARDELLGVLRNARLMVERARASPEEFVSRAIGMLPRTSTRTAALLMLSDAIDANADISDAVPLLKKYLPAMEPAAQDIALALLLCHHFNKQEDSEILAFLRHENPRYARNAADYLALRAFSGLEVSLFVPELVKMVYHNDANVARSAYNAIEAAAILTGDEIAVLYLKSVYLNGIAES